MSVKIRLAVTGKKNQIAYRIVASDTRTKRDGKTLEILGFYNPTSNAAEKLHIEKDKIGAWVKKGAIITPAVALLIEKRTLDRPKKPRQKRGSPAEGEAAKAKKEEAAPAAPLAPAVEQAQSAPTGPQAETPTSSVIANEAKQSPKEEIASSQAPRNDNEANSDNSETPKEEPAA